MISEAVAEDTVCTLARDQLDCPSHARISNNTNGQAGSQRASRHLLARKAAGPKRRSPLNFALIHGFLPQPQQRTLRAEAEVQGGSQQSAVSSEPITTTLLSLLPGDSCQPSDQLRDVRSLSIPSTARCFHDHLAMTASGLSTGNCPAASKCSSDKYSEAMRSTV